MKYEEFDKKYNKRDYRGVILETSIIDLEGNIIFHGTLNEVEDFWDENAEPIWDSQCIGSIGDTIDGKEVVMSNIGRTGRYSDYFFDKLHFNVDRS